MEQMASLGFNRSFRSGDDNRFQHLIKQVLLPWHTFGFEKKCTLFSKHTCHEVNFFLFKKDKPFFKRVVLLLIKNKLEKQFVDQYLLASSDLGGSDIAATSSAQSSATKEYKQYILRHVEHYHDVESLNIFEQCLLVEFTLLYGSQE